MLSFNGSFRAARCGKKVTDVQTCKSVAVVQKQHLYPQNERKDFENWLILVSNDALN